MRTDDFLIFIFAPPAGIRDWQVTSGASSWTHGRKTCLQILLIDRIDKKNKTNASLLRWKKNANMIEKNSEKIQRGRKRKNS
jgi:hypothetical protein